MAKKIKDVSCYKGADKNLSCCKVESVVSIDDRGQFVLPKDIRNKLKIRAGDKLAVVSWKKNGEICCISLMKVENLTGMVKGMLGPLMKEIIEK
jgi:AbrB family looped-hinge helix DNA binding protein